MLPRLLHLHPATRRRLTRLSKEAERDGAYRVAKRLQAVVLNAEGRTSGELAAALKAPRSKISEWLAQYQAHGVEGRVPFLDPVVANLAYRLPDNLKIHRGLGKWLLRSWLANHLPVAEPFAAKRGFTVPVRDWLASRPQLGALVAAQPAIVEICRPGTVETLFRATDRRTAFAAWTLLFYALWHRCHIRGLPAQGDVFETLSAKG